mgnify:FL=1
MDFRKNTTLALLMSSVLLAGCSQAQTKQTVQEPDKQLESMKETTDSKNTDTDQEEDDDFDLEAKVINAGSTNLSDTDGMVKITSGGTYEISGNGKTIAVDAKGQNVKLVLDGANLEGGKLPGLYIRKAEKVDITLKGSSTISYGSTPTYESLNGALYSKSDVTFSGEGSLTVNSDYESGIKLKDNAVFESGTFTISAKNDGIRVNEKAEFKGGTYTIDTNGEGIEAKDTLVIDGGNFAIHSSDDAVNAANSITINGGSIQAVSDNNDGIDSNGDLIINGGLVSVAGSRSPESCFDTDGTPFEINGGTVIGVGGTVMTPTSAKQPVILLGVDQKVSKVEIQENGNSIASFQTPDYTQTGSFLILSDPHLQQGKTYSILINGEKYDDVTLEDLITQAGNASLLEQQPKGPGGGFDKGQKAEPSDGFQPGQNSEMNEPPQDFGQDGQRPEPPEGFDRKDRRSRPGEGFDTQTEATPGNE